MEEAEFSQELIHEVFKLVWSRASSKDKEDEDGEFEAAAAQKKSKTTTANANALKLACELLRLFVVEAIDRAALIAEAEGMDHIEATHMERMLPQFLLDF